MLADIDRLLDRIYKPETVSLIESVSAGSVHLIGQPNGSVKSIALTEPRDLTADQLALLRDLLLDADSYFFARKRCIPNPPPSFVWTAMAVTSLLPLGLLAVVGLSRRRVIELAHFLTLSVILYSDW